MNAFVVSDIHGCYHKFISLLEYWNRNDELIILGDSIDRGSHVSEVIYELMKLKRLYGNQVTILMGNHEDMFLSYLNSPNEEYSFYHKHGGAATVRSLLKLSNLNYLSAQECVDVIIKKSNDIVNFILNLPLYHQFGKVLFTHAGFQSLYSDWKNTNNVDYLWIRNHYKHKNESGLVNVFGHTMTQLIHQSNDIWVSKCNTYISIDGGCAFGGQLNGLLINDNGIIMNTYKV